MLDDHQQRQWDDVERFRAERAEEPEPAGYRLPQRWSTPAWDPAELPVTSVIGACLAVVLIVLGGPVAGLLIGGAAVVGGAVWRRRRRASRAEPAGFTSTRAEDVAPPAAGARTGVASGFRGSAAGSGRPGPRERDRSAA